MSISDAVCGVSVVYESIVGSRGLGGLYGGTSQSQSAPNTNLLTRWRVFRTRLHASTWAEQWLKEHYSDTLSWDYPE